MFGSRGKGKNGEREVAKLLTAWWRQLEPTCIFHSTPQSGGWSSKDVRAEFKTSGDLVTTAKSFPFTIEVKRREQWVEHNLFLGKPSPVWGWWRQALGQAAEQGAGAVPMLWLRHNREPWLVLVPEAWWHSMGFASWRASRGPSLWPRTRGPRPLIHVAARVLAIHPRQFTSQRKG